MSICLSIVQRANLHAKFSVLSGRGLSYFSTIARLVARFLHDARFKRAMTKHVARCTLSNPSRVLPATKRAERAVNRVSGGVQLFTVDHWAAL